MTEFMTEQLVKRRTTTETILKKAGLIALTVIVGLASMLFIPQFMMFLLIIMIVLDNFLFKRMNVEFEYAYFSGDLTIDKIFNMQSRKRLLSVNIKEIDVVAWDGSAELRPYGQLKTLNYSSQEPEHKMYVMVTMYKGEKVKVVFEPNEEILKGMKTMAPRKVFI